jgi:hypothetical protein
MRGAWELAFCSSVLATSACGNGALSAPDVRLIVQTDKSAYSLASDRVAQITLTNHSGGPVYLPMGSYVGYERLVGTRWEGPFQWFAVDGIGRSILVPTGDVRTDELEMWFYLAGQPGTYRIQYWIYGDARLDWLLPLEERVSIPFVVTR